MSEWRDISTAPIGYDGYRFNYILFLGMSASGAFSHPVVVSGYMDTDRKPVQWYHYKLKITHWMPLPEPPPAQQKEGEK